MRNIVAATDFSSRSDRAIRRGALLAKQFGAALHLVHIVDDDWHKQLLSISLRESEALLKEQVAFLREKEGVQCTALVKAGEPSTEVANSAAELGADLLVLGPHRRELLRDIFAGTTAERTIRTSRVPVLMATGTSEKNYSRIVAAVDLSPCSADALQTVRALGLQQNAELWALHCAEAYRGSGTALAMLSDGDIAAYLEAETRRAGAELGAFADRFDIPAGYRTTRLVQDSVAATILSTAAEMRADLITVGTRGQSGIERLMLGSVAAKVLGAAQVDVLAVPAISKRR